MNTKALRAFLFLAFKFNLHVLRRIKARIAGLEDGYARFLDNFSQEGIRPLRPEEREMHYEFSGCINCGICFYGSPPPKEDPRLFAVSYYRDLNSGGHTSIMDVREGDNAVQMCPTRVPLGRMLSFMGGKK